MKEILENCAGLDIHQRTIVACIMTGLGQKMKKLIKTFGTTTDDLRTLGKWLREHSVNDAAMESTGIYWVPVVNVLEDEMGLKITLANPRYIKNVPGKKTDVKDAEWICQLFKHGLIAQSFIASRKIRRLKSLVRYKRSLVEDLATAKNRVIKTLEACNIKMSSVFSDVFGVCGRKILHALAHNEYRPDELMKHVSSRVKASKEDMKKALTGTFYEDDSIELMLKMERVDELEIAIDKVEQQIKLLCVPHAQEIELLKTIPGVSENIASVIVAELGVDMDQFPSDHHVASWAGLVPGNNESAGKKYSSSIRSGNKNLKKTLVQSAWSIAKMANTFLGSFFRRIKIKRGAKRAAIAVAHKIVVIAYWVLKEHCSYKELGADYGDQQLKERRIKYLKKQIEKMGFDVQVTEKESKSIEIPVVA